MPARKRGATDVTDQATDQATDEATDQATDEATDQATDEATDQATDEATDTESADDQADKPKRGRRVICRMAMANGSQCELPKGHDGPHDVVKLDDDEIGDMDLTDEALAELLGETKTPGIRPNEQLVVDRQVAENYAAWVAAGSDTKSPIWKVKAVAVHKRDETEKLLRKAGDYHDPKIGVRIKQGPIRKVMVGDTEVSRAMVIWAGVKRVEKSDD